MHDVAFFLFFFSPESDIKATENRFQVMILQIKILCYNRFKNLRSFALRLSFRLNKLYIRQSHLVLFLFSDTTLQKKKIIFGAISALTLVPTFFNRYNKLRSLCPILKSDLAILLTFFLFYYFQTYCGKKKHPLSHHQRFTAITNMSRHAHRAYSVCVCWSHIINKF